MNINDIHFSGKEEVVVREFLTGVSYKVIASRLNISPSALEYHIRNIMNKTGCKSKAELWAFLKENTQKKENNKNSKTVLLITAVTLMLVVVTGAIIWKLHNHRPGIVAELPQFQENVLERTEIVSKAVSLLKKQNGIGIIAIAGEGGAGKTFVGREILSQCEVPVRWEINAETSDSAYNSFLDLANRMLVTNNDVMELEKINKISDFNKKRKRLMNFVSRFLRSSSGWCLLFDNVDSIEEIRAYIPQNADIFGDGSVIITTRDTDIGDVNFIRSSSVINIGHLSEAEQRKLFCDILYKRRFEELGEKIQTRLNEFLSKIPKMPLDVVAAAYYLKNTKISFEDYEKIMQNSYRDVTGIQERLLEKNVNYNRTRYGIVSSVFEETLKEKSEFKMLLFTLCLLDSQNLPKKLLKMVARTGETDEFLYNLRRHSLIIDSGDSISIHRSSQSIGLDYTLTVLSPQEKTEMVKNLCNAVTPYERLEKNFIDLNKLIPHLKAFLNKLNNGVGEEFERCKVSLAVTIGDIYRHRTYQLQDALKYFQYALKIGEENQNLNEVELGKIFLKAGEICTVIGENDRAATYLNKSVMLLNEKQLPEFVRNHRLIGVIQMRRGNFKKANEYFRKALSILENNPSDNLKLQLVKANIYSDMAFNYFMNGINRNDAPIALEIIQKAIDIISVINAYENLTMKLKLAGMFAVYKSRLAGIYNALGQYKLALKTADEAEKIIDETGVESANIFYAQGVIARERGLANLRLNNVSVAYGYFMQAKKIFLKSSVNEYLFRLKMHEAECLVRLNKLDEALSACNDMFLTKNRERNNYCDLFYNTCFYHAAVISYKKRNKFLAEKYFRDFFRNMKVLCKNILESKQYDELCSSNAFDYQNITDSFVNSLKIFEAIYWKDYEFTKYYVEKNIDLTR